MIKKRFCFYSPDPGDGDGGGTPPEPTAKDYIDQIKQLKENTVSKEEYEKLQQEKKDLLQALVDGKQLEQDGGEGPSSDELIATARKIIFEEAGQHTNLEIAKATLDLYTEELKKGVNIFLPNSSSYHVNDQDVEASERIAEALQHCIEYANGDSESFNSEFTRILKEPPVVQANKYRARN